MFVVTAVVETAESVDFTKRQRVPGWCMCVCWGGGGGDGARVRACMHGCTFFYNQNAPEMRLRIFFLSFLLYDSS